MVNGIGARAGTSFCPRATATAAPPPPSRPHASRPLPFRSRLALAPHRSGQHDGLDAPAVEPPPAGDRLRTLFLPRRRPPPPPRTPGRAHLPARHLVRLRRGPPRRPHRRRRLEDPPAPPGQDRRPS